MSKISKLGISFGLAAVLALPALVFADSAWWCNSSFGTWWGTQNCQINSGQAGVLVYVQVVGPGSTGTTYQPQDFTVSVSGAAPTPAQFQGSLTGTPVVLGAGSYAIMAASNYGYKAESSAGCSGTIAAGQHHLCVIKMQNPSSFYPTPVPYPYPYNYQPLVCTPSTQTVSIGNIGHFEAQGGRGAYNWQTAERHYPNHGPILNVTFGIAGTQTVTVTSGGQTATCQVVVTTAAGYGYRGEIYPPLTGAPIYTGAITAAPTAGTPTLGYNYYPALPNTGFEPAQSAVLAFALVLLTGASVATYPYARKAFVATLG